MGFEFTINSARAGLNLQRGRIEAAHFRMSESSLITHATDQACLPWDTETQDVDLGTRSSNGQAPYVDWVMFQNRLVLRRNGLFGGALYAETSPSDPTLIQLPITWNHGVNTDMYTVKINGIEKLGLNDRLYNDLDGDLFGTIPISVWSLIQVPLPGDPVLVRVINQIFLKANDQLTTAFGTNALMAANLQYPHRAIGAYAIGGRPVRAYWFETANSSVIHNRITSTNLYGTDYQHFFTSMDGRITGVDAGMGGLLLTDSERVIFTNGSEHDLRILHDVKHYPGYFYYVAGVKFVDNIPFAEVNRVPIEYDIMWNTYGADLIEPPSEDPVYRALWRFDWEIGQWSQVSEWTTWDVAPGVDASGEGNFGRSPQSNMINAHVSAWPKTSLPYSPSTRYFHIFSAAGDTNPEARKFQEPVGTNPYSWRQNDHDFGEEGTIDFPGLLFPPGTEYVDKYLDAIEWGGQDTGGTASVTTVYVAEHGRIDELDPPPFKAEFRKNLSHASRIIPFPANQTSMLFPQVRAKIERGSETDKTPQAFPITIHGHIDIEPQGERPSWISKFLGLRRSKG